MKKFLQSFNVKDATIVITSFPEVADAHVGKQAFNAVGWHSQKTLVSLASHGPVLVLAEKRPDALIYKEPTKNLGIYRVWKKGSALSLLRLLGIIRSLSEARSVFVQFEFNVFGGIIPNLTLLLLIALVRLSGKCVTFELHQVITTVKKLEKHVQLGNSLSQLFFDLSLKAYYKALGVFANTVIVFEEALKNKLANYVNPKKITLLSLAVEEKPIAHKSKSRKKLGLSNNEFVVMVFGFINGYKGIDWIIDAMASDKRLAEKKIRLLIAGGKNPYLKNEAYYKAFYNSIVASTKKHTNITYSGFVPEKKVATYFAAADILALPYEVFMSASGPFSLALSYKKPVILSAALSAYADSDDIAEAMEKAKLTKQDVFFPLEKGSFASRLLGLQKNPLTLTRLGSFSSLLASSRSQEVVTAKLFAILHKSAPSLSASPVMAKAAIK